MQLLEQIPAFFLAAGEPHHPGAGELAQLGGKAAHHARGGRHDHGLARLELAFVTQRQQGRDARQTENPQIVLNGT